MLALLDHRAPKEAEKSLLAHGHRVFRLPASPRLPAPVAAHADLLLFFAPEEILSTKGYFNIAGDTLLEISSLAKKPLRLIKDEPGDTYPNDVLLNAVLLGDTLFCNPKTVAKRIFISLANEKTIAVKQGYTKCSILPVGSRALITEDAAIANIGRSHGFEVLLIEKGFVSLPGYDTGFLGGASSFSPYTETDEIFFCGNLESHPDGKKIQDFCARFQKKAISLGDFPLLDVGSIFLI